jgi:spore coat protein U-like protein
MIPLGVLLAHFPGPNWAATSADFQVVAQIESGCLVNSSMPANNADLGVLGTLDFGQHSSLSTATVQASLIRNTGVTLSCTPGTALAMRVDGGQNFDGNRRLRLDAGSLLVYRIYQQPNCNNEIPVASDVLVDTVSAPDDIEIPIYGCVVLPGTAAAGTYQDTLIVTLAW